MSGIPPNIPASTTSEGLHTPASEWASKTTSALNPETTNTAQSMNPTTEELMSKNPKYQHPERNLPGVGATSSNVSTPGIPGAYHEDKNVARDQHFSLSDTATKVSQTVQTTAQKAGEAAAQYLPQSVVDTVSAYMRESMSHSSLSLVVERTSIISSQPRRYHRHRLLSEHLLMISLTCALFLPLS